MTPARCLQACMESNSEDVTAPIAQDTLPEPAGLTLEMHDAKSF